MGIKIDQLPTINGTESTSSAAQVKDDTFKFTLISNIEEKELQTKLHGLMDEIQKQGEKLGKHMDIKDMKKYRSLVKEFLNEVTARSHEFSRENFLDKRGRHRVYGIVKCVNKNLDELAEELLKEEKDNLAILNHIDEIRGMLIDVAT